MDDCSAWWEMTLLYFFSWSCTWFGQNEPIKVQNFRLSTAHVKFHQICTLIGSLKYKILAKKYRGVISHDPEDWCKIWRKTDLFQKWQEFGEIWPEHSKVYKTWTFICSYCAKYLMFDLKSTGNLKKNWLVISKLTWKFKRILIRALKVSKMLILMCSLWSKVYIVWAIKVQRSEA